MKNLIITAGFLLTRFFLQGEELLLFHVSTIDGENLPNVFITIVENTSIKKTEETKINGLASFKTNTDEFENIGVVVRRQGWVVVSPAKKNFFELKYIEKKKVIEIVMQQLSEVRLASMQLNPSLVSYSEETERFTSRSVQAAYYIQIKASSNQLTRKEILSLQKKVGNRVDEFYIVDGKFYPYKYRVAVESDDDKAARIVLKKIRASGYFDAFIVSNE